MLKKIKKKEKITFDEKQELRRKYYSKSRELCTNYDYDYFKDWFEKDRNKHLDKLINDLTDIRNRILELEKE